MTTYNAETSELPEILYFPLPKKVLFRKSVRLKTAELPCWRPRAIIDDAQLKENNKPWLKEQS